MDGSHFAQLVRISPGTEVEMKFGQAFLGNQKVETNVRYQQAYEDGVILSLSHFKSQKFAERLNKEYYVRIIDVERLFKTISIQLNPAWGRHGPCNYTRGFERNVFLKANEDKWQQEYRLYWNHASSAEVSIPPGTAVEEAL